MRYSFLLLILLGMFSCTQEAWTDEEKNIFLHECSEEGGSSSYCECYMEKTMDAYPRYEESNNIPFEEAVELAKDCE